MEKEKFIRTVSKISREVHTFIYQKSNGRVGSRFRGGDVLLLTATGRKTRRRRATPLMYLTDGDDLVVVASNGGMDWSPAWWLNLQANPLAEVQVGARSRTVRAEEADPAERARLWPLVIRMSSGYATYQQRTKRVIPLIKLHPAGGQNV